MATSHYDTELHDELMEMLAEEIEMIESACAARVRCHKHLEQDDDDYLSLEVLLDRWGDRRVPKAPH